MFTIIFQSHFSKNVPFFFLYFQSVLSADLVYVLLFPQLLLVLYWNEYCNSYGCLASFSLGIICRVLGKNSKSLYKIEIEKKTFLFELGGEPLIGLRAILHYPFYDGNLGQLFPFRTMSMIVALLSHVIVSLAARWIFLHQWLPKNWDFLKCFNSSCQGVPCVPTIDEQMSHYSRRIAPIHQEEVDFKMAPIPRPKLRRNHPIPTLSNK